MRERDRSGGGAVPFVLAASVEVDLSFAADHRHRLRSCTAHADQLRADRFGNADSFGGGTGPADHHPRLRRRFGQLSRRIGTQDEIEAG